MAKTRTTKIKKQFKDKTTGEIKYIEIDYAKVPHRLAEFHKSNKNGKVETSYNLTEKMICFKAIVTLNVENPERFFTGHSLGKLEGEKAFEKLETIAVGRALAFAGFLADGEIASFEEMQEYEREVIKSKNGKSVSVSSIITQMKKCDSIEELEKNRLKFKESDKYSDPQKNVIIRAIDEKIIELKANV